MDDSCSVSNGGFSPAPIWVSTPWSVFPRDFPGMAVLQQAAHARNLRVDVLASRYYVMSDGARSVAFWNQCPETTSVVARRVSLYKPLTKKVLETSGIRTPSGSVFGQRNRASAWKYAKEIGFPLVVKPTSGDSGRGVTPDVRSREHFELAWTAAKISATTRIIVERHVHGNDFRLFVLGDRVVAVTQRVPANVQGDGRSSIAELIEQKNEARRFNPSVGANGDDRTLGWFRKQFSLTPVMRRNLIQLGLEPSSVLEAGRRVQLHATANIGAGGDSVDVTDRVHPAFHEIAVRARGTLPGAVTVGVDLLVSDISAPPSAQDWAVCEINTFPDLALHHFPLVGTPRDVAGTIIEYLFPGTRRCAGDELRKVRVTVTGGVTGVGYRRWLWRHANLRALSGWTRNRGATTVEALFCGAPRAVEDMLETCWSGPRGASVTDVSVEDYSGPAPSEFLVKG